MVDGAGVARRKRGAAKIAWWLAAKRRAAPLARDAIRTCMVVPFDYTMMLRTAGGYRKAMEPVRRDRVAPGPSLR